MCPFGMNIQIFKLLFFQAEKEKENVKNKKAEHLSSARERASLGRIWYRLGLVERVPGCLACCLSLLSVGTTSNCAGQGNTML